MKRTRKEITRRLVKSYITAKGDRVPRKRKKQVANTIATYVSKSTQKCNAPTLKAVGYGINFCMILFDLFSGISKLAPKKELQAENNHTLIPIE